MEIHLFVARKQEKAIEYLFNIILHPDGERLLAATASFVVVCVSGDGQLLKRRARALPPEVNELIEEAPEGLLPPGRLLLDRRRTLSGGGNNAS